MNQSGQSNKVIKKELVIIIAIVIVLFVGFITSWYIFFREKTVDDRLLKIVNYIEDNTRYQTLKELPFNQRISYPISFPSLDVDKLETAIQELDTEISGLDNTIFATIESVDIEGETVVPKLIEVKNSVGSLRQAYQEGTEILQSAPEANNASGEVYTVRARYSNLLSSAVELESQLAEFENDIQMILSLKNGMASGDIDVQTALNAAEQLELHANAIFNAGDNIFKNLFAFEYVYNQYRKEDSRFPELPLDDYYIKVQDALYDKVVVNEVDESFKAKKATFVAVAREVHEWLKKLEPVTDLLTQKQTLLDKFNDYSEKMGQLNALYAEFNLKMASNIEVQLLSENEAIFTEKPEYIQASPDKRQFKLILKYLNAGDDVLKFHYTFKMEDEEGNIIEGFGDLPMQVTVN